MTTATQDDKTKQEQNAAAMAPAGTAAMVAPGAPKRGLEQEIDVKDIIIPRARLLQPTTPEVAEQSVPGAKMGELMNSITKRILPKEFVAIAFFKNWGRFNPRKKDDPGFDAAHEPGATIWISFDKDDPRVKKEAEWGPNNEKPLATAFLNFLAFFPGEIMPVILSFSKTSYKAGKQLLSLATMCEGDLFSRKYRVATETRKNDQGTFAVMKVEAAGLPTPEEAATAEAWYEQYGKSVTTLRMDAQVDEEVPGSPAPGGAEEDIPF